MKIFVIGYSDSIHTVNWLRNIDQDAYKVFFFPSRPYDKIHSELINCKICTNAYLIKDYKSSLNIKYVDKIFGRFSPRNNILAKVYRNLLMAMGLYKSYEKLLEKVIHDVKPEIVHLMDTQSSGYLYNEINPPNSVLKVILSVWGIDLHYFSPQTRHFERISQTLSKVDLLIVEGKRDKIIAKNLGYNKDIKIIQATGGIDLDKISKILESTQPPSKRNSICLKGTQNLVRRGLFALAAITKLKDLLKDTKIYIYSATEDVINDVIMLRNDSNLDIEIVEDVEHLEMIRIFSICKANLVINRSDGMSNSMLESMAVGCFPIISNTSCAEDIILNGKNGYIVEYFDVQQIAEKLKLVLNDNELVDSAMAINQNIIKQRYDSKSIKKKLNLIYG